ncbi:tudor domain-containing protein 1, partial [Rhinatrema bivittatum]|uniref:tudor domain-containing protein 1 n=1 Tax=Rhinatrema bivittatum TaxID=194408 RepID=UPI001128D595
RPSRPCRRFADLGSLPRSSNKNGNGSNKEEVGSKTSGRIIIGKHLGQFSPETGHVLNHETESNKVNPKAGQSVENLSSGSNSSLLSHPDESQNHDSGSKLPHTRQSKVKTFSEKYFSPGYDLNLFNSLAPVTRTTTCHQCGLCGTQRCAKCKQAYYCSASCQKEDWPVHSVVCKPISQNKLEDRCKSPTESRERENDDQQVDLPHVESPSKTESSIQKKIMLSDLQNFTLTTGMEFQGTVQEFKDPSEFFMQICSSEIIECLGKLTLALEEKCTNSATQREYWPVKGEVCAAKYSQDQNWYRVLIQDVDVSQRKAQALYIDYGNKEDVALDRIQPLHKEIELFSPFAIKCSVANIAPKPGGWTRECISTARRLLLGRESCSITILDIQQEDTTCFSVDVLLQSGKHLDHLLLEMGYAISHNAESSKKISPKIGSILDEALKHFKEKGTEIKKELNEAQSVPLPKMVTVAVGEEFPAVVSEFKRPEEFFCQQLQSAYHLSELQKTLREHCQMIPSNPKFSPVVADICCAQFTEDNQWYRATVLEYLSEGTALVGYVDYGNCEVIPVSRLRPLIPKLLELPIQAIKCALAGVKPLSKTWKPEAIALMKQLAGLAKEEKSTEELATETNNVAEARIEIVEKPMWTWAALAVNQVTDVIVCMLYSPGDFYCQIYKEEDLYALNELNKSLVECCQETCANAFKPAKGKLCCAFFSGDGNWYRGLLKELNLEGAVKVHFVDYGNVEKVPVEKLHHISSKFLTLPFQAIGCKLAGVKPVTKEWSPEATKRFQSCVHGVKLQARAVCVDDDRVAVELHDFSSECPRNIGELLVTEHLAVKEMDKPEVKSNVEPERRTEVPKMEAAGMANVMPKMAPADMAGMLPKRELMEITNEMPKMESVGMASVMPNREPAGMGSVMSQREQVGMTGMMPKENFAGPDKMLSRKPVSMVNRMPGAECGDGMESTGTIIGLWKTVELPVNAVISAQVVEVMSPDLFYILPKESTVDKEKLQWVMIEMAEYCSRQTNNQVYQPKTGEACCARFTGDNHWYRAVVLDSMEFAVKVIYVDYGNVESLPFSRVLPIKASCLELPFHIIKCSLAGIEAVSGLWSPLAKELMRKLLLGMSVVATVLRVTENTHILSLELEVKNERINVAEKLIRENLAKCSSSTKSLLPSLAQTNEACYRDLLNRVNRLEKILQALLLFMGKHMEPEKMNEIQKLLEE